MYETYFNLKEKPFSLSPDPRYIYLTAQHMEALAKCEYSISQKMGISIIYGDIGAGKTSLARRLWEKFASNPQYNFAMLVHPNFPSAFQLVKEIRREFGNDKPRRSISDEIDDFRAFLIREHNQGKTNVLVIDEAQNLRHSLFEILRQLLNFETNTQKLLQIVLFGQNELGHKIDREAELKDRVTIFGALTSLTIEDAKKMIDYRWQMAGGNQFPFEDAAVETIFKYSRGLPRKICKLCDNALIRAASSQLTTINSEIVEYVAKEVRLTAELEDRPAKRIGRKKKDTENKKINDQPSL
jgi:general secretion pathway protein A